MAAIPGANQASTQKSEAFYITGGTLPVSAISYVARAADAALLSALQRGEFCYVLNTRQMGKSSLMARTAGLLRQAGAAVAILDLTAVGQNLSVAQWYNGLLERVGQQLGLEAATEDYWDQHRDAGPMQRFLGALREVALPAVSGELVIFIDEIDAVRSLPFATDELFAGIRELYNRRTVDAELNRLTFCLLGVASPADLIRDTRMTPFNIGTRIDLTDFTPAEAAPLAQGMVGSKAVLDRALHWTGGHPYLTQRLCRAVADVPRDITPADVDALCARLFLSERARDTEDNLLFVRERVLRTDLDLAALLSLYGCVLRGRPGVSDDPADPLVSALKLAGLVKADPRGRLQVRNRIYARVFGRAWIQENMPGAEVRRQRRAFRRGAWRVGSVAAVIVAIIGTLAGFAVKEAHEAQRQTQEARRQSGRFERLLYVSDMQNAQSAWDNGNLGRLRDLLSQTKSSPERGWEWGYWNHLAYPPGDVVDPGDGPLLSCDITQDGSRLITAGGNGMLRVWDTRTLRPILSVHHPGPAINTAFFNLDGSKFGARDGAGGLALFGTATGKMLYSFTPKQSGVGNVPSNDFTVVIQFAFGVGMTFVRTDTHRYIGFIPHQSGHNRVVNANHAEKSFNFTGKPFNASIYSFQTGARLCRLQLGSVGRQDIRIDGEFSDDDRHLMTHGTPSGSVDLWDAATGRLVRHLATLSVTDLSTFVRVNPHAPFALIYNGGRVSEYSTVTGQKLLDVPFPGPMQNFSPFAFSADGRYLGFIGTNGGVFLLDCKTGTRSDTLLGHTSAVTGLAFLPGGRQFCSISSDGTLRRWNIGQAAGTAQTLWRTVRFPPGPAMINVALLDSPRRAWTTDKTNALRLWSITADRATLLAQVPVVAYKSQVSDNLSFVAGQNLSGVTASVYDLHSGHKIGDALGDAHSPNAPVVASNGRFLATVSKSGDTSVFDVHSGKRLWTQTGSNSEVSLIDFSLSSRLLCSGGIDRVLDFWDARTGRKIAALTGSAAAFNNDVILPDDRRVVADSIDQTMRCWDIATGRTLWAVQNPLGISNQILSSPDGRRLLTASALDTVGVWDAQTGDLLLTLHGCGQQPIPKFSPDGGTLEINNVTGQYVNYAADMRDLSQSSTLGGTR